MKHTPTAENLLLALTPGGSEFIDDPQRCYDFAVKRVSQLASIAHERNEIRDKYNAAFDPETGFVPKLNDAAEMLWTVIANVSGGDWSKQSAEWQEAAIRWRDNYFAALELARKEMP